MDLPVLVDIGVGFHMRVQHRLVDTRIVTLGAFEGFGAKVIAKVIF